MDKQTQQRIFEPFFSTKQMGRGTGLGLASVYGIVKSHRGSITVYSEKKQGTSFHVYLPAAEKTGKTEESVHREAVKGTETILLVDDEDMIREVGQRMLEALGYRALSSAGGKEALEIYEKEQARIHLVILDMIMPAMSGAETFDRLKEINPSVKILLSSGYSVNGQASNLLERGCDGFIQKPFNLKELSVKIRSILDRKDAT
jgi:CheY-like chemotaxis protein